MISLALIAAVAFYGVTPWVLILLTVTWIPDIVVWTVLIGVIGHILGGD